MCDRDDPFPGLLIRHGERTYCDWAGAVNQALADGIQRSPCNIGKKRILFVPQDGLLRLPRQSANDSQDGLSYVHGNQQKRSGRDNWHLQGHGMSGFYKTLRFFL